MAKPVSAKIAAARVAQDHAAGFNAALDKAIDQFSRRHGAGEYLVDVQFWAELTVVNPGTIQQYGATITPRGGGA